MFGNSNAVSDFVRTYCEVLDRNSTVYDYATMTEMTTELLHALPEFRVNSGPVELQGIYKMCSYVESTLTKKIFFFPPSRMQRVVSWDPTPTSFSDRFENERNQRLESQQTIEMLKQELRQEKVEKTELAKDMSIEAENARTMRKMLNN